MLIDYLLKKVEKGEIDPYQVDIEKLIGEFRAMAESLSSDGMLRLAGSFLQASVKLLKYKLEYFFPTVEHKRERKITLEEVKEVLKEEEQEFELEHFVSVGRKAGSKNKSVKPYFYEPEPIPLHKAMKPEDYMKAIKKLNLYDFKDFESFFYSLKDPIERVRFFMAWLMIENVPDPVFS